MDRTRRGWALVVIGIVIALVAALAETLGLADSNGFGLQQAAGIVVGVAVSLVGARRLRGADAVAWPQFMDRTRRGWALVVIGIVIALVSALAEPLGLGDSNGFGLQQAAGIVVGVVVSVVGARQLRGADAVTVIDA